MVIALIMSFFYNAFAGEDKYSFARKWYYNKNKTVIKYEIIVEKNPIQTQATKSVEPYWRIGPENLPVTEDQCYKNNFEVWLPEDEGYGNYRPCLQYGPQEITYDQNKNKLYFAVASSSVGVTGIGERFIFAADLNKKEIIQLGLIDGPPERYALSPNGQYLAFSYDNKITILDTLSRKRMDVLKKNVIIKTYHEMHFLDKIHWIDDNHFTFLDYIHDDYTNSSRIFENTYDVLLQEITHIQKIQNNVN